jgi:hypothetical protein
MTDDVQDNRWKEFVDDLPNNDGKCQALGGRLILSECNIPVEIDMRKGK